MYKVLKEQGYNNNVTLLNVSTGASLIIGRMTMSILHILELKEDYVFNDSTNSKSIGLTDEWNLEVSDSTAAELQKLAMDITTPTAKQKASKAEERKKQHKKVNAMDVLLGLATYD